MKNIIYFHKNSCVCLFHFKIPSTFHKYVTWSVHYLLSVYYVPSIVLSVGVKAVNQSLSLIEGDWKKTINKHMIQVVIRAIKKTKTGKGIIGNVGEDLFYWVIRNSLYDKAIWIDLSKTHKLNEKGNYEKIWNSCSLNKVMSKCKGPEVRQ